MTRFQGDWNIGIINTFSLNIILQYDPISRGLKPEVYLIKVHIFKITIWPDFKGIETDTIVPFLKPLTDYNMTRFQGDWNVLNSFFRSGETYYNMTRFQGDWNNLTSTDSFIASTLQYDPISRGLKPRCVVGNV